MEGGLYRVRGATSQTLFLRTRDENVDLMIGGPKFTGGTAIVSRLELLSILSVESMLANVHEFGVWKAPGA